MSIDRLNSAVWAAGFAMAPTEDDALEERDGTTRVEPAEHADTVWRSATSAVPAVVPVTAAGAQGVMRQWLTGWQRKATA